MGVPNPSSQLIFSPDPSSQLGHGQLIPRMADRPMSSKKLRWKKNGQKLENCWNVISLLLLGSQLTGIRTLMKYEKVSI